MRLRLDLFIICRVKLNDIPSTYVTHLACFACVDIIIIIIIIIIINIKDWTL